MKSNWRKDYTKYRRYISSIVSHYEKKHTLKIYLELFLSLATISIFAIFALRPTLITIAELYREIKGKEETIEKLDEKIRNLNQAQNIYRQEEDKILLLISAIPKDPSPDSLVRQLEGLSSQVGASVSSMNLAGATLLGSELGTKSGISQSPLSQGAAGIEFGIDTTSTYSTLSSFLSQMEILRRPPKIDSIEISVPGRSEGQELILVVSGRAPYLREGPVTQAQ